MNTASIAKRNPHAVRIPVLAMLVALTCFSNAFSAEGNNTLETEKGELLRMYAPHYRKIVSRYTNIDILETSTGRSIKASFDRDRMDFRFRGSGSDYRIDYIKDGRLLYSGVNTKQKRFKVKTSDSGPYAPVLQQVNQGTYEAQLEKSRNGKVQLAFAPYCWLGIDVFDYLASENTTVVRISHDGDGLDRRCTVDTTYVMATKEQSSQAVQLVFLENRAWVLEKFVVGQKFTTQMEYDDDPTGVPLIRTVTNWRLPDTSPENPQVRSVRTEIGNAPTPSVVFSPADFGLPPFDQPKGNDYWNNKAGWYLAVFVVGGAVLSAQSLLRRKAKHLQRV